MKKLSELVKEVNRDNAPPDGWKKEDILKFVKAQFGEVTEILKKQVDDIYKTCQDIKNKGGNVVREAGPMMGSKLLLAFIEDPNGYKIELIQKGTF